MARIDDYEPDLWQPPVRETEGTATPPPAAEDDEGGAVAPLAHPKIQAALREVEECFLAPGGSLSLFCGKFLDPETIELHQDLTQWETDNPYDASKPLELGYHYLYVMQDYPKAVLAYHSALKVFDLDPEMHSHLGQAYYGMGDYKKSFEVYGAALEIDSRNVEIRRLRFEAGPKYLETLDDETDADEIARVRGEMVADKAMLVALNADKNREAFADMKAMLAAAESPEEARELLDHYRLLAQSYGALGGAGFADPADADFVRGELGVLSGDVFGLMAVTAQESPFEEINRLFPLYHGLSYLARGDVENARDELAKVRSDIPEAAEILKTMETNDLRSVNLAALDVWESTVEGHEEYEDQKETIDRVRASIRRGESATIKEALTAIAEDEEEGDLLRGYARELLERTTSGDRGGSEILPHLIEYASTLEPSEETTEILFEDAQRTEGLAPQGSYGVYCLLESSAPQDKFKTFSQGAREELTREKGFWETFGKTVFSLLPTSPDELVLTMVGMGLAQKIGALGRLAALARLGEAGMSGRMALRLALGAEILAEGHVLFAWNTAQGAAYGNAGVLSPENLAMSYGSTLLMLGFVKPAANFGKSLGPRIALRLGMLQNGALTHAGERLAWATAHGFGLGGLIASTQANQLLGLLHPPSGGFAESLAHDLVAYVKYGFAEKVSNHVLGPKAAAGLQKIRVEIALREARLLAEAQPLPANGDSRNLGLEAWHRLEAKPAAPPSEAMTQEKFHQEVIDSWAQRDTRRTSARNARRASGNTGVTRVDGGKASAGITETNAAPLSPGEAVAFGYAQAWESADYWSGIRGNFPILLRATGKILKMTMQGNLPPATGVFEGLLRAAGTKTENPEIRKRAGLMARALERVYDYYPEGDPQRTFIEGEVAALTRDMAASSSEAALPVYWSRLSDVFAHLLIEHAGRAEGAPRNPVLDFQLEVASEYAVVPGGKAAQPSYRTQRY